jgi:hypothetical protein
MTRCGNDPRVQPTPRDRDAIEAFSNFLSWGEMPSKPGKPMSLHRREVPPAWYAYALGRTTWCPPEGEL